MRKFLSLLVFLFLFFVSTLWAAEIKVAIFPFKINAKEDLSYVKQGIQDMLSTRLYDDGKVLVIDQAKVNQALKDSKGPLTIDKAREIGEKLGADYVVIGSLTSFGQKVSLDAKIIPVKKHKTPFAVYTYANDLDDLVPKLDDFAKQGLAYLEGKPKAFLETPKPIASATQAKVETKAPPKALAQPAPDMNKMHPERVFRMEQPVSPPNPGGPQGPPPPPAKESYKYSEVDSWPDYRPETVAPPTQHYQVQQKPKKRSFWSKILPWNWFGGDEEGATRIPKGSVPPPPPPPEAQGSGAMVPGSTGTPPPPPGSSQPVPSAQAPSQGGKTWEWY